MSGVNKVSKRVADRRTSDGDTMLSGVRVQRALSPLFVQAARGTVDRHWQCFEGYNLYIIILISENRSQTNYTYGS